MLTCATSRLCNSTDLVLLQRHIYDYDLEEGILKRVMLEERKQSKRIFFTVISRSVRQNSSKGRLGLEVFELLSLHMYIIFAIYL